MHTTRQTILVAGAGGTLGLPLVRRLAAAGHEVTGLTRSVAKLPLLEAAGARALVVDALDRRAVRDCVRRVRPDQIVNLLTALPAGGALRPATLRPTNDLRRYASQNLLRAAMETGVRRVVAESFVAVWGDAAGRRPLVEEDAPGPIRPDDPLADTIAALRDLERQHLEASARHSIETVVLRYGFLYGPGVPSTETLLQALRRGLALVPRRASGSASWIHIDDAIAATEAVLQHPRPATLYQVCDDAPASMAEAMSRASAAIGARAPRRVPEFVLRWVAPVLASMAAKDLAMSNARIRRDAGWRPAFANVHEGLAALARRQRSAA